MNFLRHFGPRALLGAALAAAAALACGDDAPDERRDGERRPLVVAYQADLQTLNPLVSTDQNANDVMYSLLYTPLVAYDSAYRPKPWLAESWSLSDTAVVFTLRDDVAWHDGEPVTAEDVKFTFDRAKDPAAASPMGAAYLSNVESAEVLGPHRVRFEFTAPHAEPLHGFYWPPVPEHRLGDVPPGEMAEHPFGRDPVGSGPYRFTGWRSGEALTFRRADSFPEGLGGRPEIGRVVYRVVPERTTRLRELLRGELHVDGPLAPADADRVRSSDAARLQVFPWRMFTYLGWNTRDPLFAEAEVRRAMTLALDRGEMLEAALYDFGSVASGPIPPWHPYAPGLDPLPHAPDSARALLEANGWTDRDGDGVREREDGTELRFRILTPEANQVLRDAVQIAGAHLREVGVAAEPALMEWQAMLARHRRRDFQAVLTNWVLDSFRVDPRPLFHSDRVEVEGSANRSSYANPVADSLMDAGTRTRDPERAEEIWAEFARVLQRDQPFTFLFWNEEIAGVSTEIEGVEMDARGELRGLPGWRWRGEESR